MKTWLICLTIDYELRTRHFVPKESVTLSLRIFPVAGNPLRNIISCCTNHDFIRPNKHNYILYKKILEDHSKKELQTQFHFPRTYQNGETAMVHKSQVWRHKSHHIQSLNTILQYSPWIIKRLQWVGLELRVPMNPPQLGSPVCRLPNGAWVLCKLCNIRDEIVNRWVSQCVSIFRIIHTSYYVHTSIP